MGESKTKNIPYDKRSDDQKLVSNWNKARKLVDRCDWSAAIIRVATSAEIAANIYIRRFLMTTYSLPEGFADALLIWANGLDGKFKRLIKPAAECEGSWEQLRAVQRQIETLNRHRNSVIHSGRFKSQQDAEFVFERSLTIIKALAPSEATKLIMPDFNQVPNEKKRT
jgi:hypothetical protein